MLRQHKGRAPPSVHHVITRHRHVTMSCWARLRRARPKNDATWHGGGWGGWWCPWVAHAKWEELNPHHSDIFLSAVLPWYENVPWFCSGGKLVVARAESSHGLCNWGNVQQTVQASQHGTFRECSANWKSSCGKRCFSTRFAPCRVCVGVAAPLDLQAPLAGFLQAGIPLHSPVRQDTQLSYCTLLQESVLHWVKWIIVLPYIWPWKPCWIGMTYIHGLCVLLDQICVPSKPCSVCWGGRTSDPGVMYFPVQIEGECNRPTDTRSQKKLVNLFGRPAENVKFSSCLTFSVWGPNTLTFGAGRGLFLDLLSPARLLEFPSTGNFQMSSKWRVRIPLTLTQTRTCSTVD